ncbi:hypothetical protein ES702_07694 [subsurface metagenome]
MEFTVKKDINISKNVTNGTTLDFFSFQVPSEAKMTVTHFANGMDEFDAWGHITWIFKRNGILIEPYGAIKDQIAFGAPLRELAGLEIQGGDLFQVFVKNEYIDPVKVRIALKYEMLQVK